MRAIRVVLLTLIGVAIAMLVVQNLDQSVAVIVLAQVGPTLPLGLLLLACFAAGLIVGIVFWLLQGLIRGRTPRTRERRYEPEPPAPLPSPTPTWSEREPDRYSSQGEDYRWSDREELPEDDPEWR